MLQLAHFSVKEYLTSGRLESDIAPGFHMATASALIAKVSLAFMLQFKEEPQPGQVIKAFPFAEYAAEFWMSFAAVSKEEDQALLDLIEIFFCFQRNPYTVCYALYRPDEEDMVFKGEGTPCSPLYYSAFGGLRKTVRMLLERNTDVDGQGGCYGNALQAASAKGHEAVVKLLLDKGVDVNVEEGVYGNALYAASSEGHEHVVKLLLDKGADVNAQGGRYGNALQAASAEGHEAVVKLLLNKGADVNFHGGYYSSALQAASCNGHEQVVNWLLDKGMDINAVGGAYCNAIQEASLG